MPTTTRDAPPAPDAPDAPPAPMPREVVLLGWVSFFADVSSEMVYPLLPLFLVVALGESATSLGWVEGAAMAVVAILTAVAGWRSDRIRRRLPYVRAGYGLPVAGKAILALATAWPLVLLGRTVDRVGKGIRSSPRDALIADAAGPAQRGRAFGLHRAMDTAGAVVGSVVAAALLWWLTRGDAWRGDPRPFRIVFGVAAVLGIASFALTFVLREPPRAPAPPREPGPRRLGLPRTYWIVVGVMWIFALANSSDAFLLLRAADVGVAPWAVVAAYAMYNVVASLVSYPAGALSDRIGRWRVIAIGWIVYAAVYVGFATTGATGVWPLLAIYGAYLGLTDGVGKALVADHAPPERRGLALGIFYLVTGGTTLAASVAAGLLWDRVDRSAPFWFGAAAAVAALACLPFAARATRAR